MMIPAVLLAGVCVGGLAAVNVVFQDAWIPAERYTVQQGLWIALIFALPIGAFIGFLVALFVIAVAAVLPSHPDGGWKVQTGIAGVCVFAAGAGIVEVLTSMNVLNHFEVAWWIAIGLSALGAAGFVLLIRDRKSTEGSPY